MVPAWVELGEDERDVSKVHALVPDDRLRRKSSQHKTHVWHGPLPDGSTFRLSQDVYVTSPAFEFLLLASQVSLCELIAYGNELCGLYSFDTGNKRGFRSRVVPLLTVSELQRYIEGANACRGCRQAKKALDHIMERLASPMESVIAMLNCLPYRLGGYGLAQPAVNHPVPLSVVASRIAGRGTCVADLCYPDVLLDIEYHGRYDHDNAEGFDSDRSRVNGLLEMEYEVIELTFRQVADLGCYEAIVLHVAKRIGKRIRKGYRGATSERLCLRRFLFEWNRRSGEPREGKRDAGADV